MIKDYTVDSRVKLILALCITTMSILFDNIIYNSIVLLLSLAIVIILRANLKEILKKLKPFLLFFILLSLVQSVFNPQGKVYFRVFNLPILTSGGIVNGLTFLSRMLVIILSGIIISTSSRRDVTQGLIQMKLPYELAFMTNIAILFIPTLRDEINNSITAIELRGIDIKALKLKDRMSIYSYLVLPIIMRSINSARTIAMAMDVRAFRLHASRSSLKILKLNVLDYIIIILSVLGTIFLIYKFSTDAIMFF